MPMDVRMLGPGIHVKAFSASGKLLFNLAMLREHDGRSVGLTAAFEN